MPKRTELIIITGYLGSGKTSLLNNCIRQTAGESIGILLNDFGKITVDASLLRLENQCIEDKILEINHGSIFCSCRSSEFAQGLEFFSTLKPDRLFVETSGLSDPSNLKKILTDFQLFNHFPFVHSICLVDAQKFLPLINIMKVIERQIQTSPIIIINKIDLIPEGESLKIQSIIRGLNPAAAIHKTTFGQIDICWIDTKVEPQFKSETSLNTPENKPASLIIPQTEISLSTLQYFLDQIRTHIMRLKGFYRLGDCVYYINNNADHYEINTISDANEVRLGLAIICSVPEAREIFKLWRKIKPDLRRKDLA